MAMEGDSDCWHGINLDYTFCIDCCRQERKSSEFTTLFDFGIEAATNYGSIAFYGNIWYVEFIDYSTVIVIEDPVDSPDENYILTP